MDNKQKQYPQLTIKDLVDYVFEHKRKQAFLNWGKDELAVWLAGREKSYIVATGVGGITGVCIYEEREDQILYILQVLTTRREALKSFAREFRKQYPGWTIEARRRGKILRYNRTNELISRLIHQ